jgi:uncharacterized DUF497 family protein
VVIRHAWDEDKNGEKLTNKGPVMVGIDQERDEPTLVVSSKDPKSYLHSKDAGTDLHEKS